MRSFLASSVAAASLVLSGVVVANSPSQPTTEPAALPVQTVVYSALAETPGVTIKRLPNRKVKYRKSTRYKPLVKARTRTKVLSKTLTVKKGSKTVARNKSAVRVKAGTYKVTTKVRYKTYRWVTKTEKHVQTYVAVPAWTGVNVSCLATSVTTPPPATTTTTTTTTATTATTTATTATTTTTTTTTEPVPPTTEPTTTSETEPTTTEPVPPTTEPTTTSETAPTSTTEPTTSEDGAEGPGSDAQAASATAAGSTPDWVTVSATCTGSFDGAVKVTALTAGREADPGTGAIRWIGADAAGTELSFTVLPVAGKSFEALLVPTVDLTTTDTWYTKKKVKKWSSVKRKSRTQKLVVKQGKKPGSTAPYSNGECPSWAPIKGNINTSRGTKIYHLPDGRWYDVTFAEVCFSSVTAAKNAGFRASKNG